MVDAAERCHCGKCNFCKEVERWAKSLHDTPRNDFQCMFCFAIFDDTKDYSEHLRIVHCVMHAEKSPQTSRTKVTGNLEPDHSRKMAVEKTSKWRCINCKKPIPVEKIDPINNYPYRGSCCVNKLSGAAYKFEPLEITEKTIRFRSTDENFWKEKSGKKNNTVRDIDEDDERYQALSDFSNGIIKTLFVEIEHTDTKEVFRRRVCDATFWERWIITWDDEGEQSGLKKALKILKETAREGRVTYTWLAETLTKRIKAEIEAGK